MRQDLLDQAKELDVAERVELVEAIWDTLHERAGTEDLAVPEAHQRELDRRLAAPESDAAAPWSDVRARLSQLD